MIFQFRINDNQGTVIFRSFITIEGQNLPAFVILDNTIFAQIRVQISPCAMTGENELAVLKLANDENEKYKPFKLYFDQGGNLLLDVCMIFDGEEVNGDTIYTVFGSVINYLEKNYRAIMKTIW